MTYPLVGEALQGALGMGDAALFESLAAAGVLAAPLAAAAATAGVLALGGSENPAIPVDVSRYSPEALAYTQVQQIGEGMPVTYPTTFPESLTTTAPAATMQAAAAPVAAVSPTQPLAPLGTISQPSIEEITATMGTFGAAAGVPALNPEVVQPGSYSEVVEGVPVGTNTFETYANPPPPSGGSTGKAIVGGAILAGLAGLGISQLIGDGGGGGGIGGGGDGGISGIIDTGGGYQGGYQPGILSPYQDPTAIAVGLTGGGQGVSVNWADLLQQLGGTALGAISGTNGAAAQGGAKGGLYRYDPRTGKFYKVKYRRRSITISEKGAKFVLAAVSAGARIGGGRKRGSTGFSSRLFRSPRRR